jgi:hypothetical protein
VPHTHLTHTRRLGAGAFGDVDLVEYVERGLTVAVKCNGTNCADAAAIDNERHLDDKLLLHPHDNILPVYGICVDAPDGKVRLVMKYCEKGSLDDYLTGSAKHELCDSASSATCCCVAAVAAAVAAAAAVVVVVAARMLLLLLLLVRVWLLVLLLLLLVLLVLLVLLLLLLLLPPLPLLLLLLLLLLL